MNTKDRYESFDDFIKMYAKCSCGNPIIIFNKFKPCGNCGNKFMCSNISISQPHGQSADWPTRLNRKNKIGNEYPVKHSLKYKLMDLSKKNKSILKELKELGCDVYTSKSACFDGRMKTDYISISLYVSETMDFKYTTFLKPRGKSNSQLTYELKLMLKDIKSLRNFQKEHDLNEWTISKNIDGEYLKWKPEEYNDSEQVVLKTGMVYHY